MFISGNPFSALGTSIFLLSFVSCVQQPLPVIIKLLFIIVNYYFIALMSLSNENIYDSVNKSKRSQIHTYWSYLCIIHIRWRANYANYRWYYQACDPPTIKLIMGWVCV